MKPSMRPNSSSSISGATTAALILLVSSLVLLLISGHSSSALENDGPAGKGRSGRNFVGSQLDDKPNKSDERLSGARKERSLKSQSAATNKRDPPPAPLSLSSAGAAALASEVAPFEEPHGLESSARSSIAEASTSMSSAAAAAIGAATNEDMATAAGHHYGKSHGGGHGKYYMYVEVPKKGAYKMGFRRGNHKHMIERKESAHKSHVHSYFKWHDKKGKGSHKFEFKHGDHKKKHY